MKNDLGDKIGLPKVRLLTGPGKRSMVDLPNGSNTFVGDAGTALQLIPDIRLMSEFFEMADLGTASSATAGTMDKAKLKLANCSDSKLITRFEGFIYFVLLFKLIF